MAELTAVVGIGQTRYQAKRLDMSMPGLVREAADMGRARSAACRVAVPEQTTAASEAARASLARPCTTVTGILAGQTCVQA